MKKDIFLYFLISSIMSMGYSYGTDSRENETYNPSRLFGDRQLNVYDDAYTCKPCRDFLNQIQDPKRRSQACKNRDIPEGVSGHIPSFCFNLDGKCLTNDAIQNTIPKNCNPPQAKTKKVSRLSRIKKKVIRKKTKDVSKDLYIGYPTNVINKGRQW